MRIPKIMQKVVMLGFVVGLLGCQAWHARPSVAQGVMEHPDRLRVSIEGEDARVLEALRIESDSLIGFEFQKDGASKRFVWPVSSVERVERRELDRTRTLLFVAVNVLIASLGQSGER